MKKRFTYGHMLLMIIIFTLLVISVRGIYISKQSKDYYNQESTLRPVVFDSSRPTILVGHDMDYAPYSFLKNDSIQGFNVELIGYVAEAAGYNVEHVSGSWHDIRVALDQGDIHVVSGMFINDTRKNIYEFSTSYGAAKGEIFSKMDHKVSNLNQLSGETIVVQKSDVVHEYLKSLDLDVTYYEVLNPSMAIELVESGQYKYAALLKDVGHFIIAEANISDVISNNLSMETLNYAVASLDQELIHGLNSGLQDVLNNGIYQELYDKWLGLYTKEMFQDMTSSYIEAFLLIVFLLLILIVRLLILAKKVRIRTTALVDSNDALINSKVQTEALIEAIPDVIFIFSTDGVVKECKANKQIKISRDIKQFVGQPLRNIVDAQNIEVAYEYLRMVVSEGQVASFKYQYDIMNELRFFEMRFSRRGPEEVLGLSRDITEEVKQEEHVVYLKYHDELTGLKNRSYFNYYISSTATALSVIIIDIDGLKIINDSFGLSKGDEIIVKVAAFLESILGSRGIVIRNGGDEFLVVYEEVNLPKLEVICKDLMIQGEHLHLEQIQISITIGWAVQGDESVKDLLMRAENMLHQRKIYSGPSSRSRIIDTIMHTLHEANPREEAHSQRVSQYSYDLAKALNLSDKEADEMKMAGLLHDIGKVAISDQVINKKGKLTDLEYEEMKRHSEKGFSILSSMKDMEVIAGYIRHHHERWDGFGYPHGLKGEDIPVHSRIITIADSFDAMISERCYKEALTTSEAIKELIINMGKQFDPNITPIFIKEVLNYEGALNEIN